MIFFISDTHFCHSNIIKYCNRPYSDVDEMNKDFIERWNSVVGKDDIVYHLGDFALCDKAGIKLLAKQLNGTKYLVRGNHDHWSKTFYEECGFNVLINPPVVLDGITINGNQVCVSHTPIRDSQMPKGCINLHGHIHEKKLENCQDKYPPMYYDVKRHFNISCDVLGFKPLSLTDLEKEFSY